MMRLSKPEYSFEEAIDECLNGISGNSSLRRKLTASKSDLIAAGTQYVYSSEAGKLYTMPPANLTQEDNPLVVNDLRTKELIKIYDQYFVPENKPARKIYNALLNSAKEKCPFCGGIGAPRNLDHFLPKAHFPQFSVQPYNLVPACRDCNMAGKAHAFAMNSEEQILHPYADEEKYFIEQWIFAIYNDSPDKEPGDFEYFINPPVDWLEDNKKRVRKHFADFDLAKRYSTKAAELLGTVLGQINALEKQGIDSQSINSALLQPGIDAAPFQNHWQVGMYQALMVCNTV